jgi:hypothetical protein
MSYPSALFTVFMVFMMFVTATATIGFDDAGGQSQQNSG